MTFTLPRKTHILWQIRTFLVFAAVYTVIVIFCRNLPTVLLPTTIAMAIGSVFVLAYVSIYLNKYKITVDNSIVYITKGVIFKTTIIIPHPHLAFIKSFTTPLMSGLKLRCIILKVARGCVFIPELDSKNAENLIRLIRHD